MATLTTEAVRKRTEPGTLWDTGPDAVKGFGLRVYPSGVKSFFINYRMNGAEQRHAIGKWPTWSVTAARERAKEVRRGIDNGENPNRVRRERQAAPTVGDLIDRYIEEHLPTKSTDPQRVKDEKAMLNEIGKRLKKGTLVAEVNDGDIKKMHREITDSGRPVRANRILAIASKMFSLALTSAAGENKPWRSAADGNPCKGVKKNQEKEREHFFSEAELQRIADALAGYRGGAADCVRLIMLTGARPKEAMRARWEEFDKESGYWIKPPANTKQRKVHKAPLGAAASELIEKLRKERKAGATWVFPGQVPGEPIVRLTKVWAHVREHANLAKGEQGHEPRIYDLRHTFASVGAGGGMSLLLIGRLLGHTQSRTTQRYAHIADDPLREAAEKIGKVIAGAGNSSADVVNIKRG